LDLRSRIFFFPYECYKNMSSIRSIQDDNQILIDEPTSKRQKLYQECTSYRGRTALMKWFIPTKVFFNSHSDADQKYINTNKIKNVEKEAPIKTYSKDMHSDLLFPALNFFKSENTSLIKRCMLNAGYSDSDTDENSEEYLTFVSAALDAQRKRAAQIYAKAITKIIDDNISRIT